MRTLILDCDNLCYISRHAFGEDLSHEEEQTGIIWGFLSAMFGLAKQYHTRLFIFAWDDRTPGAVLWRKKTYPQYKANRHTEELTEGQQSSEDRIKKQFWALRTKLLPNLGFHNVFMFPSIEADDIIAALVTRWEWNEKPVVVSTDKDAYQLLSFCDVFRPLQMGKKEELTEHTFESRYGLRLDQWPEYRALQGDDSDNIPGVPGVGKRMAELFVRGELPVSHKTRQMIVSPKGQEIIDRNLKLMKLPHSQTPEFGVFGGDSISLDAFIGICNRYAFHSFLKPNTLHEWKTIFNMR